MQIDYHKRKAELRLQAHMRVQAPGFVSTASWAPASHASALPANGRALTPPPAAAGLHQLTLEAFWLD